MVFIAGIGAHFEGDIKAHTKHVLDEIRSGCESVGSSMDKVLKVNVYLNDLKDYAGMNEAYPRPLRRRTAGANDDCRRRRHPGKFPRGNRLHRGDSDLMPHRHHTRRRFGGRGVVDDVRSNHSVFEGAAGGPPTPNSSCRKPLSSRGNQLNWLDIAMILTRLLPAAMGGIALFCHCCQWSA